MSLNECQYMRPDDDESTHRASRYGRDRRHWIPYPVWPIFRPDPVNGVDCGQKKVKK